MRAVVSASKSFWQLDGRRIWSSAYVVASVVGGQSETTRRLPVISAMWNAITIAISLFPIPFGENGAK